MTSSIPEHLGEQLSAYLDDELGPEEKHAVEFMLEHDEQARRLLEELRAAAQAVASLPRHAAPESILDDVRAHLERVALVGEESTELGRAGRVPGFRPMRWAMAAIVVMAVGGGLWILIEQYRTPLRQGVAMRPPPTAPAVTEEASDSTSRQKLADDTAVSLESPSRSGSRGGRARDSQAGQVLTFDQKLKAGAAPEAIRGHDFSAEPLRLSVQIPRESDQVNIQQRARAELAKLGIAELNGASASTEVADQFFYRGAAGINVKQPQTQAWIVRAPRSQLRTIVRKLAGDSALNESISFSDGALTVQGAERVRAYWQEPESKLATVGSPPASSAGNPLAKGEGIAPPSGTAKTDGDGSPLLDGLMRVVGLDPALLTSREPLAEQPEKKSASESLGAVPATPDAKDASADKGTSVAETSPKDGSTRFDKQAAPTPSVDADARENSSKAVTSKEESSQRRSLVDRRAEELRGSKRAAPPPTTDVGKVQNADSTLSTVQPTQGLSARDDQPITVVIEFVLEQPASPAQPDPPAGTPEHKPAQPDGTPKKPDHRDSKQ